MTFAPLVSGHYATSDAIPPIGPIYRVARRFTKEHQPAMSRRSPLDDPRNAAHAWARYRMLMRWMGLFTLVVVAIALFALSRQEGEVSIHFYIATGLGIGFAIMLMAALMGLVFLSSGTGHDEAVSDASDDDDQPDDGRRR
jgi:hypothetical protein